MPNLLQAIFQCQKDLPSERWACLYCKIMQLPTLSSEKLFELIPSSSRRGGGAVSLCGQGSNSLPLTLLTPG